MCLSDVILMTHVQGKVLFTCLQDVIGCPWQCPFHMPIGHYRMSYGICGSISHCLYDIIWCPWQSPSRVPIWHYRMYVAKSTPVPLGHHMKALAKSFSFPIGCHMMCLAKSFPLPLGHHMTSGLKFYFWRTLVWSQALHVNISCQLNLPVQLFIDWSCINRITSSAEKENHLVGKDLNNLYGDEHHPIHACLGEQYWFVVFLGLHSILLTKW